MTDPDRDDAAVPARAGGVARSDDPIVQAAFLRYAVPHVIRRLRTRPLRARLLADLIRRRNR